MTRLDQAPEIIELASQLGVGSDAPVNSILDYCRRRIDSWVAEVGGVTDIEQLESLVTQRLQMAFEEIRTEEDFERLTDEYARVKKQGVFGGLRSKFDDADNLTYGALIELRNVAIDAPVRFVAVIDIRGTKLSRRFFTRWHEIAHRLTTHAFHGEPAYRSEDDPLEQLMDEIAGHIGFYGPLFDPVFEAAKGDKELLTFSTVEAVVRHGFPTASFQATLNACTRRLTTPVIYLEAALAHNKQGRRRLAAPSLFGDDPPPGELRAIRVRANDAAFKEQFYIPENMRVPADSVMHRLFDAAPLTNGERQEDLSQWESKGKPLEGRAVAVEARKVPGRVIAIVQPVEAVRQKKRQASKAMFLE